MKFDLLLAHEISTCEFVYLIVLTSSPRGTVAGSHRSFSLSSLKSTAPKCLSGWGREGCRHRSQQQLAAVVHLLVFWAGLWPEHVGGLTLLSYKVPPRRGRLCGK